MEWSLKTVDYLLNRVPSKTIIKTPYELWTGKSPSIRHLHVWGCLVEARTYIPHEKKLNSKIVSYFFVGYSERSRGFYCSSTKNIIETDNIKFLRKSITVGVNYIMFSHLRTNKCYIHDNYSKWWSSCSTLAWKYSCARTRYRYSSPWSRSCYWGRTWKFSTTSA